MSNNTKLGTGALQKNSGNNNTGIGAYASYDNTSSFNNTAVGSNSSFFNTTGANNTSIGAGSMCNNTTGSLNTAVGSSALEGTTPATSVGINNVAVGVQALYKNSADNNTGVGSYSLISNTSGTSNTGIGYQSLYKNTTANNNTALGFQALYDNTTASNNTAVGYLSLANTTAANNTAIGYQSLGTNTTGTNNTAVGQDAGNTNQTGQYNTYIGAGADANANNYSNSTALGYGATITSSNQIVIGTLAENVNIEGDAFLPNFGTATSAYQIVPKLYVDSIAAGLTITQTCYCATTGTITLGSGIAIPGTTYTDDVDLANDIAIGDSVFILVVSQSSTPTPPPTPPTPPTLTDYIDNGVYIFENIDGTTCNITRPVSPPMNSGFNATGAFSFIQNGTTYAKTGLVQFNGPSASVGASSLQYQIFFQFKFEIGQGLNVTSSGGTNYLNVDSSLDFLTLVDSVSSGTLNIGTTNATTINMGQSDGSTTTNLTGILDINGSLDLSGNYSQDLGPITASSFTSSLLTPQILTFNATSATAPNQMSLNTYLVQTANPINGWNTIEPRLQLYIDATYESYISFNPTGGSNYGDLSFGYNGNNTITSNTEVMRISKNNRVGIMNSTPAYTLDVTGTANISSNATVGGTLNVTGITTLGTLNASSVATSGANITGGTINGTTIGNLTPAVGTFTTLTSSNAAITGGTINGTTIGNITPAAGTFTTLSTSGAATLNSLSTSSATITGGTINGTTIGNITPAAGTFTTLSTSSAATLNSASVTTTLGVTGATTLSDTLTVQNSTGKINLTNTTSGVNNLAIGTNSQISVTPGIDNISFGVQNLKNNTGSHNSAFGLYTLLSNTTGSQNCAFGENALGLNTSGYLNCAFGIGALYNNTAGNNNNAFGYQSLANANQSSVVSNNAFGNYTLQTMTSGFDNSAFGHYTLAANNSTGNSGFGAYCLSSSTGNQNCAVGYYTLDNSTNTSRNTAIGSYAGNSALTPSYCTFLGGYTDFDVSSNNYSYSTAVGYGAIIDASNQIMLGRSTETVQIPGALTVTGYIQPSSGNSNTKGIKFPENPGGGAGDSAWIRYYPYSGEACVLDIGISNDSTDHIYLNPSGNVGIKNSNPAYTLDVTGTANISSNASVGGNLTVTGLASFNTVCPQSSITPSNSNDLCNKAYVDNNISNTSIPVGGIIMWSGSIIPTNWAICDGTSPTPDLRNRFVIGSGSTYVQNATGGEATVTLTSAEIPAHTHGINDPGHSHQTGLQNNNTTDTGGEATDFVRVDTPDSVQVTSTTVSTGITIQQTGGGGSHNNLPPYYALAYIMRII